MKIMRVDLARKKMKKRTWNPVRAVVGKHHKARKKRLSKRMKMRDLRRTRVPYMTLRASSLHRRMMCHALRLISRSCRAGVSRIRPRRRGKFPRRQLKQGTSPNRQFKVYL